MDIEQVSTRDLRPHPSNPRLGDVDAIVESVRLHGVYRPVIISQDGVILAGHHLVQALLELGVDTVPAVRLPIGGDTMGAAKLVLADNRTSDLARYDEGLLIDMLTRLDGDLFGTAWSQGSVDDLLELVAAPPPFDPPAAPPPPSDTHEVLLVYGTDDYIAFVGLLEDARQLVGEGSDGDTVLAALRVVMLAGSVPDMP